MPLSKLHEAARAYAGYGWPVFPIAPGTKNQPLTPHGFKDATIDLAIIDKHWTRWPDANIGFSCGAAKVGVIDVDELESLGAMPALPRTFCVRTPRGGQHHYYEGDCRSTVGRLAQGVDTRGQGGYTILPPSVVGGQTYERIADEDLAPLPAWVGEHLEAAAIKLTAASPVEPEQALAEAQAFMASRRPAGEGERNDWAYKTAAALGNIGVAENVALELMHAWNARNAPPLEPAELSTVTWSAYHNRQDDIGSGLLGEPLAAPLADMSKFVEAAKDAADIDPPAKAKRFQVLWEADQDAMPEPQWLIDGVLPDRTTAALLGVSGHHKTTLAVDLAMSIAAGAPIFGAQPRRQSWVAYGALEGKDGIARFRRPAWRQHRGIDRPVALGLLDAPRMARAGEFEAFIGELKRASDTFGQAPALIVIDTMLKAMVGWKADEQGSSLYIDRCEELVGLFDCTVLSIAHPGKDATRGVLGSQNFVNGIDTHLRVLFDEASGVLKFEVAQHKDFGRPKVPFYFDVAKVGPGMVLKPKSAEDAKRALSKTSVLSPGRVGEALTALGAHGEGDAARTRVVAAQVTPRLATDDDDAYEQVLRKNEKALRIAAKGSLAAYWLGDDMWKIPDCGD